MPAPLTMLEKYNYLINEMADVGSSTIEINQTYRFSMYNKEENSTMGYSLTESNENLKIEIFLIVQNTSELMGEWNFLKEIDQESMIKKIEDEMATNQYPEALKWLQTGAGCFGETAKVYANAYRRYERSRIENIKLFETRFMYVVNERVCFYQSMQSSEITLEGLEARLANKLVIDGNNAVNRIYEFIDMMTDMPSFSVPDNSIRQLFKLDLPTIITYAMLNESADLRKVLRNLDYELVRFCLGIIHQEVLSVCPFQSNFSEEDFIDRNASRILTFLQLASISDKFD